LSMRSEDEIRHGLLHIYSVMEECASASLDRSGYLPGGLQVRRRAHDWYLKLKAERSEEHTSELQSRFDLVCRLLLEKKNRYTERSIRRLTASPIQVRKHAPQRTTHSPSLRQNLKQ